MLLLGLGLGLAAAVSAAVGAAAFRAGYARGVADGCLADVAAGLLSKPRGRPTGTGVCLVPTAAPVSDGFFPTAAPAAEEGEGSSREELAEDTPRKPLWWAVGGGLLLGLVLLLVLLYWVLGRTPPPANTGPQTIHVDPAGGPGASRSLQLALARAHDDDHIVIDANLSESGVTTEPVKARRLTIEGPADRTVTWRRAPNAKANEKLLNLVRAEGFVVQNLTLDGGGTTLDLVSVWGESAGLRLRKLNLRGFSQHGIYFNSAEGSPERPIELSELQFEATNKEQAALYFGTGGSLGAAVRKSRFVSIRGCKAPPPVGKTRMAEPGLVNEVKADPGWEPLVIPAP
jgi:hypothetical protein